MVQIIFIKHKKEYWTRQKAKCTKHIRHIRFRGDVHNNKMERLWGSVRDPSKTRRGLKKEDSLS